MTDISFRKAEMNEIDSILKIFESAIEHMNTQNIIQWDSTYPNRDTIYNDISNGNMYIGVFQNEIAVIYVINKEYDVQYKNGKWKYSGENFRVIHRLCVNPKFQNIKAGTTTMKYIEDTLKKVKVSAIRLDAFSKNPYALKLYEKAGYTSVGTAQFRMGEFFLMEKILY